jgi:hypothetical protein
MSSKACCKKYNCDLVLYRFITDMCLVIALSLASSIREAPTRLPGVGRQGRADSGDVPGTDRLSQARAAGERARCTH